MKVFVSGEGPDELGEWCREPQYRSSPPVGGIVEALLRKVAAVDFEVIGACVWKRIRNTALGGRSRRRPTTSSL